MIYWRNTPISLHLNESIWPTDSASSSSARYWLKCSRNWLESRRYWFECSRYGHSTSFQRHANHYILKDIPWRTAMMCCTEGNTVNKIKRFECLGWIKMTTVSRRTMCFFMAICNSWCGFTGRTPSHQQRSQSGGSPKRF